MVDELDSLNAGTLEIDVESDTTGFGKQLQAKLDDETDGVAAKVGVELRKEKKLRKELQKKLDKAAAGLAAKVGVKFGEKFVRGQLQTLVDVASAGISATVEVEFTEPEILRARLAAVVADASRGLSAKVGVDVDEKSRRSFGDRLRDAVRRGAKGVDAKVGVAIDKDEAKKAGKDTADAVEEEVTKRPWYRRIFGRDGKDSGSGGGGGGGDDDDIPTPGGGSDRSRKPGIGGKIATGAAGLLDGVGGVVLNMSMIGSLIGPAVAALGQAATGLLLMAGNLATSAATLSAIPGMIGAGGLALGAMMIAWSGMTGDIKEMPPAMQEARGAFDSLKDEWETLKDGVQQAYWSEWADKIRPIGETILPTLQSALEPVATSMGNLFGTLADYLGTDTFQTRLKGMGDEAGKFGDHLTKALFGEGENGGLVQFFSNLEVATRPLVDRFGGLVEKFGLWAGSLHLVNEESDKLTPFQEFLEYAADKGAQAGRMLGDIWDIVKQFFSAGRDTGDSLLRQMETSLHDLAKWMGSPEGQTALTEFFDNVGVAASATGDIIKQLAVALGGLMANPDIGRLLEKVSTQLVPALVTMVDRLATGAGDNIINLLSEVVEFVARMGQEGGSLGVVATALGGVLGVLNNIMEKHPDAAVWVSGLVVALSGISALSSLGGGGGLLSGIFGKITQGVVTGRSNGKNGNSGGAGGTVGDAVRRSLGNQVQVYWNTAMPVYLASPGAGASGGGDGKNDKNGKPRKGGKPGKGGSAGGAGSIPLDATFDEVIYGDGGAQKPKKPGKLRRGAGKVAGALRGGLGKIGGLVTAGYMNTAFGPGWEGRSASSFVEPRRTGGGTTIPKSTKPQTLPKPAGKAGGVLGKVGGVLGKAGKVGKIGRGALGLAGGVGGLAALGGEWAGNKLKDGNGGVRDAAGSLVSGAASGAGMGAMIGSIIPGFGTAIGAGVGGVIGGAAGLINSGVDWSKVKTELSSNLDSIKGTLGSAWDTVSTKTSETWSNVSGWVGEKAGNIRDKAAETWDNVKNTASTKWDEFKGNVTGKAQEIANGASEKWNTLKTNASNAWDNVKSTASTKWNDFKGNVTGKAQEIAASATEKWNTLKTNASNAWDNVKSTASTKWESFKGTVREKAEGIRSAAASKWEDMKANASSKWEDMKGNVSQKWTDIKNGLGGFDFGRMWDGMKSAFKNAVNGVISGWNNLSFTIGGGTVFGKQLPSFTLSTPNIPLLAKGGDILRSGLTWVGERGPELLNLPRGARVTPLGGAESSLARLIETAQMQRAEPASAGGQGVTFMPGSVNINNPVAETAGESMVTVLRHAAAFGFEG